MRVRMGIMGAYGETAEELGLGKRTPPSRRQRGTPAACRSPQLNAKQPLGNTPGWLPAW
jgi:hypothetical protein